MPDPAPAATTVYYKLDDGGAIAREFEGWDPLVWRPSMSAWVDYPVNFATEGRIISEQDAQAAGADTAAVESQDTQDFGEFGPDDQEES